MNGGRIKGGDTSYWTAEALEALAGVLGSAVYYIATYRSEHKKTQPYDFNKPVPSDAELRVKLKDEQFHITRENGTEPAFQNEYWNNDKPGLYVDIITGDPLFSSLDKFDFNNGRLNFTKPVPSAKLALQKDNSQGLERTDVRTARSNSHLGWLFKDGPPPAADRYTINSAALRFIPLEKLETEGYAQFLPLFASISPTPTPAR